MSKDRDTYVLTLKGLISAHVDDVTAENIVDAIELYLRRHHADGGDPAIVLDLEQGKFVFATLQKLAEGEARDEPKASGAGAPVLERSEGQP